MERVIFIFVDGCGVGRADAGNPFFLAKSRFLPFWQGGMRLPDGTPLTAIDATLGIPGAPQSASGQTALFCGAAAAEIGQPPPQRLSRPQPAPDHPGRITCCRGWRPRGPRPAT